MGIVQNTNMENSWSLILGPEGPVRGVEMSMNDYRPGENIINTK